MCQTGCRKSAADGIDIDQLDYINAECPFWVFNIYFYGPNLHTIVYRCACIQDVLKVKVNVKGHVIRALLCLHENRFFFQTNGRTATKLAHHGLQVSLHPWCAQGQGQGQRSRDRALLFWT